MTPTRQAHVRYLILIVLAILLPYVANPSLDGAWPLGSAACLATVFMYIYSDKKKSAREHRLHCLRHQICTQCGYDLRATATRCPECGAIVEETRPPP